MHCRRVLATRGKPRPVGAAKESCLRKFAELLLFWGGVSLNNEANACPSCDSDAQVPAPHRAQLLSQQGGTCPHCLSYLNFGSFWCLHVVLGTVTSSCLPEEAGVDPAYLVRAAGGLWHRGFPCRWSREQHGAVKGMCISLRNRAYGGDSSWLPLWHGSENYHLLT